MIDAIIEFIESIINDILSFLPTSPFSEFISELEGMTWLSWLNWLVPVGDFIIIGGSWLVAVGGYYAWSVILRWIKAVE